MCYLREFRVFVAVYEERSFSVAARREHATQSAVSQRIRKLEDVLAVRLFNRSNQKVEPTPAGHAYYDHCVELITRHRDAMVELQRFRGIEGEVAVGVPAWMSRHVMPNVLDKFFEQNPNVSVTVTEGDCQSLREQISAGGLALAIVSSFDRGDVETCLSMTEGVLVSPGGNPGSTVRREAAHPADLDGARLIVPQRGSPDRTVVDNFLSRHGTHPKQILEFNSIAGTLGLVAKGGWQAILPAFVFAADPDQHLYNIQPISDPPTFQLGTIASTARGTPASRSFKHMLQAELSRITLNALPISLPLAAE